MINSIPSGSRLFIDGEPVGTTPYKHRDTRIVGSCMDIRLEMNGYDIYQDEICRDERADIGAIIGGILVYVPFLWAMKYNPSHTYQLSPATEPSNNNNFETKKEVLNPISKADQLRELKSLFDEGILTQQEYDKEKKKVLEDR